MVWSIEFFCNLRPFFNRPIKMIRTTSKTIKDWAIDDRPREKMIAKGKGTLSNAELIALLIGSGHGGMSAVELAREVLSSTNDNLTQLSKLSIEELTQHPGIGEAKAVSILAALELGRRCSLTAPQERPCINNSKDAYDCFLPFIDNRSTETFLVSYLNQGNRVIKTERISSGGITSTSVDPKVIFKSALLKESTAIVLCHNHPSGVAKPSRDDISLTKQLMMAGKVLEIKVIDHIIVGDSGYFSFAENGLMN